VRVSTVCVSLVMCVCWQLLTQGVHLQCSPPWVGAVVLVVLTGRLGGRRRAGAPQTQLATQYGLVVGHRHRETDVSPAEDPAGSGPVSTA